jgi:NAD-dependent deacetylase
MELYQDTSWMVLCEAILAGPGTADKEHHMDDASKVAELRNMLLQAKRAVVFTGAGISTESGIPDFRSPGGIWTKMQPIEFSDFISSREMRKESWRRKFAGGDKIGNAQPNAGHEAVARWVNSGKVTAVITQNVDGLHQRSGVPDSQVIELHGNSTYAACLECGKRYELAAIREDFEVAEEPPVCDSCSGIIKTATISFGQSMPVREMQLAEEQVLACDLFIAIGSSLVVYPAAGFPLMAKRNGAKLVIINREPTDLDPACDLVLNTEIGVTVSAIGDV